MNRPLVPVHGRAGTSSVEFSASSVCLRRRRSPRQFFDNFAGKGCPVADRRETYALIRPFFFRYLTKKFLAWFLTY